MRKIIKMGIITLLGISMVSLFSACKKNNTGKNGQAAEGTINFQVDGTNVTTMAITTTATIQSNALSMQGSKTEGSLTKAVSFVIYGYNGVGTYAFKGNAISPSLAIYSETTLDPNNPTNPESRAWVSNAINGDEVGEISISEVTATHVKGTFHFKGLSDNQTQKEIKEGSFNVRLQQ
ncbi:MAG TPA: DUF6252 family protein [Edaphocola sp.]|nr:DUF6252 family protein [Edaphocola sp.]